LNIEEARVRKLLSLSADDLFHAYRYLS
jgi:hypothetical protein